MPTIRYIFIDLENKPSFRIDHLSDQPACVVVVAGKQQAKTAASLVARIAERRIPVSVVFTDLARKDALDFVLACEVGIRFAADPRGHFVVVSSDTGFDALIEHLRAKGAEAERLTGEETQTAQRKTAPAKKETKRAVAVPPSARKSSSNSAPAASKSAPAPRSAKESPSSSRPVTLAHRVEKMRARVAPGASNRPKRLRALRSLIKDQLGSGLADAELDAVLAKLKSADVLRISDQGAVTYPA
jgi:hypothetical protein